MLSIEESPGEPAIGSGRVYRVHVGADRVLGAGRLETANLGLDPLAPLYLLLILTRHH